MKKSCILNFRNLTWTGEKQNLAKVQNLRKDIQSVFHFTKILAAMRLILILAAVLPLVGRYADSAEFQTTIAADKPLPEEFNLKCKFIFVTAADEGRLIFNYKDERNYYYLRVAQNRVAVVKLKDGAEAVLAEPDQFDIPKGKAIDVLLKRRRTRIVCAVGQKVVLRAEDDSFTRGKMGFAVSPGMKISDLKYQRVGDIQFSDDFMRKKGESSSWQVVSGTWQIHEIANSDYSASPFRFFGKTDADAHATIATTGYWFWDDYCFKAAIKPNDKQASVGLCSYYKDDGNYYLFRWLGKGAGKAQILKSLNGKETVIAEKEICLDAAQWYEFVIVACDDIVRAYIDGNLIFDIRSKDPQHVCGKAGLYLANSKGTLFDDVVIKTIKASPAEFARSGYDSLKELIHDAQPVIAERFKTDRLMMVWSSKRGEFVKGGMGGRSGTNLWHQGVFYGDVSAGWKGRLPFPPSSELKIAICADPKIASIASGYMLDMRVGGKADSPIAILSKAGKEVARGKLDLVESPKNKRIKLSRKGSTVYASVTDSSEGANQKVILEYKDPQPLKGGKVAFAARKVRLSPLNLDVLSKNICDYTFFRAPVDWRVATGTWSITSRWICNPKYTWLGGMSDETAVMWNKRSFSGDITLNLYLAMHMDYGRFMGYNRRGDLNVTICGDGRDVSSGYNFIFGGWDNMWTRILRGEKVVAETNNVLCPEDRRVFHNTWFHVIIQKIGNELFYYIDGKLVLTYSDPDLLRGKHIALWTYDGGLMIARATIFYEKSDGIPLPITKPLEFSKEQKERTSSRIRVSSTTHPSVQADFEQDDGGWASEESEHSALVHRSDAAANSGGSSLQIVNPKSGGDFTVRIPPARFDAAKFNRLSFAYKIPPQAKVNLYLRVNGTDYVILFNGAPASQEKAKVLGKIDAITDDAWHRADFNLLRALRRFYPSKTAESITQTVTSQNSPLVPHNQIIVEDLRIGNWSNGDYLLAGFGGNYQGVTYHIDDFFLGAPGGARAVFQWKAEGDHRPGKLEYSFLLDQKPDTVPDDAIEGNAAETTFEKLASGTWYFHIKAKDEKGNWTQATHYRIEVDGDAPTVTLDKKRSTGSSVVFHLSDANGIGVDPESVNLTWTHSNGQAPPDKRAQKSNAQREKRSPSQPQEIDDFSYGDENETLCLNLDALGPFAEGETIEISLAASDLLGNKISPPFRWQWKADYSKDKIGPQVTLLSPESCPSSFSAAGPHSSGVVLSRDRISGSGEDVFAIYNKSVGEAFQCYITRSAFDACKYPMISFDYKIPPGARFDLAVDASTPAPRKRGFTNSSAGQTRSIIMNDAGRLYPPIGSISGLNLDDKWHRAELNLYRMLKGPFSSKGIIIRSLAFAASEQGRNVQETAFRVANFRLHPTVNAVDGLSLRWSANDISGVAGYSYVLDNAPGTIPHDRIKTSPAGTDRANDVKQLSGFRDVSNGAHYFHIKAKDGAGNWGPVSHNLIVIQNSADKTPPLAATFSPANAASAATDEIALTLKDDMSGVSVCDVHLWVDNVRYEVADPCLSYDERTGKLKWNRQAMGTPLPPFPNGKEVPCKLAAADYAGNKISPISWKWKFDYAKDQSPPLPPRVMYIPSDCLVRNDFESSLGEWTTRRAGWSKLDRSASATGKGCVNFGGYSTFARSTPFIPARHPFISFDYNIPRGGGIDFIFRTKNNNWEIFLTAPRNKYPVIGTIPGIRADSRWHHAELDFRDILRKKFPDADSLVVDHLATMTMFGGSYYIDNFVISANRGEEATFEWDAPLDPTGIAGYSFTLDDKPSTLPDETSEGVGTHNSYKNLKSGVWYFHIRAQDGAGNWGSASNLRFTIAK